MNPEHVLAVAGDAIGVVGADAVVAGAAGDDVAHVVPRGQHVVVSCTGVQMSWPPSGVMTSSRPSEQAIVAGALALFADVGGVAVKCVRAVASGQAIVASAAEHVVATGAPVDAVAPVVAEQPVVPVAAEERVVTRGRR